MTLMERLEASLAKTEAKVAAREARRREGVIAEATIKRPTATRVIVGGLLGGPIGALVGFAARKKETVQIRQK